VVTVRPEYPAWFAPIAEFAEHRPIGALVTLAVTALATFGAGVGTGILLKLAF
jgi:hypothetical protein